MNMFKTDLKQTGDINCAGNPRKRTLLNTVEWNQINWRKVELSVFKLQKRIYQASKSKKWVNNKYWHTIGMSNWRFSSKVGEELFALPMHSETKIVRHKKVKGDSSPFDGNTNYWVTRMGKHPEVKSSVARLLKKQQGRCN